MTAQRVISSFPTKTLAQAILPDPETINEFSPFISRNKRYDLTDEIRIQQNAYASGSLSPKTVYDSILYVYSQLEKTVYNTQLPQE
jgi:hypothetical protein